MESAAARRAAKYREKADEVLSIAESMKDHAAKAVLLNVSKDHLSLAEILEHSALSGDVEAAAPDRET